LSNIPQISCVNQRFWYEKTRFEDDGNKTGNEKRFYLVMIPIADREFTAHLEKLKKE